MSNRFALSLVFLCCSAVSASAEHQHDWEFMLGKWTFESDDGKTSDVVWRKASDGHACIGIWTDPNGTKSTELLGWRPDKNALVVDAYGSADNYWHCEFTEVEKDRCKGEAVIRFIDGTVVKGTMVLEKVDKNKTVGEMQGTDGENQDVKLTWKWTRVKKQAKKKEPSVK